MALALFELAVLGLALRPKVSEEYRAYYITKESDCWRRPIPERPYTLGSRISLARKAFAKGAPNYVGCGWQPEDWGLRPKGRVADLQMHLLPPASDLVLQAEMQSVGGKQPQKIEVKVLANDTLVATWRLPAAAPEPLMARIPSNLVSGGVLRIAFEVAAPSSQGGSHAVVDRRDLSAIGIRWFSLSPAI